MNPKYFGDSYDIVKRFFCSELAVLGYKVVIRPMLTGSWEGKEPDFYRFIGADPGPIDGSRVAVFFDPDTGVGERASVKHISLHELKMAAQQNRLAFSFDQSFSRQHVPFDVMKRKLSTLHASGSFGMYYDSHARFLFAASKPDPIEELKHHLHALGLPASRLITHSP